MKNKMLAVLGFTLMLAPMFANSAQASGSNSRETAPVRCVLYHGCPPVVVAPPAPVVAAPPAPVVDNSPVSGRPPTSGKP